MAAKAVLVPFTAGYLGTWDRFQALAEQRIREGNMMAGEDLWEIVRPSGAALVFTIRSTKHRADFVECSLDLERATLTCKPGAAIQCGPVQFQLIEGAGDVLRQGAAERTLDEAITLVLDKLVWMEDCGGEALKQSDIEAQ